MSAKTNSATLRKPIGCAVHKAWRVTDDWPDVDWPDVVPVTRAEIEVLEIYLGSLLEEILGGKYAA